jgi:hypothetical protein
MATRGTSMKATKAYIASLGTTGVLLGASLLMLAVVSAVVAFDRWPSGDVSTRVQTVVLADSAPGIRIAPPSAAARTAAAAARATATAPGAPERVVVPGAPVNGVQRVAGERTTGSGGNKSNPLPVKAPVDAPQLPQFDPGPLFDGDPAGFAGNVANTVQAVAGATGGSVGQASPETGAAVTQTGTATADAIRNVPLPGKLFP